jgi:hypothetical protein
MVADPKPSRFARRSGVLCVIIFLAWLSCAFWNFVKPMPPGTHVTSLSARLAESQVDFIDDLPLHDGILAREYAIVDRAEQAIILDQSPLAPDLAQHLLTRKRQRPNLKVVLVTDPRNEVYGGTPAQTLSTLEASGIIVARSRLERLRDSNPLYSSFWRLSVGWWSDPFDETPGAATLVSSLRRLNFKADERQLLVADDGAGGWSSIIMSAALLGPATGNTGLEIRGHLARDIAASELRIAAWSTDDDRLPDVPPIENRNMGAIDARFLSEGAIHVALGDAIAAAIRSVSPSERSAIGRWSPPCWVRRRAAHICSFYSIQRCREPERWPRSSCTIRPETSTCVGEHPWLEAMPGSSCCGIKTTSGSLWDPRISHAAISMI